MLSVGTVLAYVSYWIAVIVLVVFMKYSEGRTKMFGYEGEAYRRRRAAKADVAAATHKEPEKEEVESVH